MRSLMSSFRFWMVASIFAYAGIASAQVFGDVVITEVMFNDTAGTDLEWIEIHNTTASAIDISGWIVHDTPTYPPTTGEGALLVPASTTIPAGGYLVLSELTIPELTGEIVCSEYDANWALGNGGDNLALYTAQTGGILIDGSLTAQYPSTLSAAGNSIEKCSPNATWTSDPTAWHESTNIFSTSLRYRQCTPGAANSPCGDVNPPVLLSATAFGNTTVQVLWDESVDLTTSQIEGNYVVSGGVGSPTLAVRDGGNNALVHLTFNPIANGTYQMMINGVQDLFGNAAVNQADSFTVNVTVAAGAVVITEVMYDDTASTDVEWIEIHNTTGAAIDISNWIVADSPDFPPTSEGYFQVPAATSLPAYAYLVLSRGVELPEITGEIVCGDSVPSAFNNSPPENVVLLTAGAFQIVDGSFTVSFPDLAAGNAGNSIEKCDSTSQWSGVPGDWHESTNVFAATGRYRHCTPGAVNSVCAVDTTRPTLSSVAIVSGTSIDVSFSEGLFEANAETPADYSVNLGVGTPVSAVLQGNPTIVRLSFASELVPNTYTLTVSNVTDLAANPILPNSTIGFTISAPAESLVISEIMPNPAVVTDDNGEWFEVYNRGSSPVNLSGWVLLDNSGRDTIESGTINPGQYFVFCNNADSATNGGVPENFAFHFGTGGWGLALANGSDVITLRNTLGQVVTTLAYTSAFAYSSGSSGQLSDLNSSPNDTNNWCPADTVWSGSSGDAGTPGAANFCTPPFVPDTVTICQIRGDQDACGIPTRLQERVVTRGVVTWVDTCQTRAFLEDNGCAVLIFGGAVFQSMPGVDRPIIAGDSVMIDGYITQFRGLTEFSTFASFEPVLSYLGTRPLPAVVTIATNLVTSNQNSCGAEPYESRTVKVNNLTFVNGGGTFSHGDSNYVALSGTDTVLFRVDSCDAILGSAIPSGAVNVTAAVGQHDTTTDCRCGEYQLVFAGVSPFESALCPNPASLTVIRNLAATTTTLRWQPGLGSTCTTYKVYYSNDGNAVFPNTYVVLATVNALNYTDTNPLSVKRFYYVTSDN